MIDKKWNLGVQDRGHGHYSYAILDADGFILLEVGDNKELADRIIMLHNRDIDNETRTSK